MNLVERVKTVVSNALGRGSAGAAPPVQLVNDSGQTLRVQIDGTSKKVGRDETIEVPAGATLTVEPIPSSSGHSIN